MLKLLFFLSLIMIFYIYLGYPALIYFISLISNKKVKKAVFDPFITIIIAAYNEENCIENTIKNKLALDYPKEKLEIIVISDDSTDRTDDIVTQYKSQGVKLLRQEPRAGKTSALNMAVPMARGEIIVFSDANSIYSKDTLYKLVRNFHDQDVGYVTGKMKYINPDGSTIGNGCSAYMRYENLLRQFETRVGSVVGVDGGIDAIRKRLYCFINHDQLPDLVLPLKVVEKGYRVVYEPEAILKEFSLNKPKDEYRMRVRVALRALWALSDMRRLLSLNKYTLFALQLWSHKILRYLGFIFLLIAYLTNWALCGSYFYQIIFIGHTFAYLGAGLSFLLDRLGFKFKPLYLLHYFVLVNLASAHAFIKFLRREKQVIWAPRKGEEIEF